MLVEKFKSILEHIKNGCKAEPDKRNDNIVLKIIAKDKVIAELSTENNGETFTLVYKESFNTSGVPPFNMKFSEKPEIGKVYKSDVLWYPFAARVPSPSRPDFQEAMTKAHLKGGEPVLEIIGKLSKISISRSWSIQLDKVA